MTFSEQNVARDTIGRFSEKVGSAAEISLSESPRAVDGDRPQAPEASLATAARNDPWANSRWDSEDARGERPMRPYLPLQPADDDEFFDAPQYTVLISLDPKEEGAKPKRYQKVDGENWTELDVRGNHIGELIPSGALWEDLNYGDMWNSPDFKTAQLNLPLPVLYSDRGHYVYRDRIDKPLSKAEAGRRFEPGAKFAVVSQAGYDYRTHTYRNGGVNARIAGDRTVVSSKNGKVVWDSGSSLSIDTTDETFERDGDIVVRSKEEYGVETVYRRIG